MDNFLIGFDDSRFLKSSTTSADPNRLNWRCQLLLTQNQELIRGQRVLDIGSHDGRFTYACLKLGAEHVVGVEGRPQLIERAKENLRQEGFDSDSFEFIGGDIFDCLKGFTPREFDVVLCCGFLYHTVRQFEFFAEMRRLHPQALIIDTAVCQVPPVFETDPSIRQFLSNLRKEGNWHRPLQQSMNALIHGHYFVFIEESLEREGSTIDPTGVVAIPSDKAVEMLLELYGFAFQKVNWQAAEIPNWQLLEDYKAGDRVSYTCKPVI